ncbi:MAG: hypothetical protein UC451_05610 [Faecalibacterium sp.]|nr:hypothetical protein [Faecalibacterium sp.]
MESFLSRVEELGAAPARQPARSSPAPARSFVNCRRFKISLLSLVFGTDPVQNIGIIKDNICGSMVDMKPLRIEKGVVRGLHLQHGVDLFIRPACGGVRLYSSTSIACGFLYEWESRDVSVPAFPATKKEEYGTLPQ